MENQIQRPAALTDWAYDAIRTSILSLDLPMGAQINIEELAEEMQVSRTPIREALLRLEGDGLVRAVSRVGFFVTEITRRDLEELFELRALLESYAAKRAALMLTDADLAHIDELLGASCQAVEAVNLEDFLEYEIALHAAITEHAQNNHLLKVMETLANQTYRERVLSLKSLENVRASCVEHRRIVAALHERDAEGAGTAMWEHIWAVKDRMLEYVDLLDASASDTG
jgi:DNA-binding GntR family transcriptional regulator